MNRRLREAAQLSPTVAVAVAVAGNAEPLSWLLIMKYMNFVDNNHSGLAGIIMGRMGVQARQARQVRAAVAAVEVELKASE